MLLPAPFQAASAKRGAAQRRCSCGACPALALARSGIGTARRAASGAATRSVAATPRFPSRSIALLGAATAAAAAAVSGGRAASPAARPAAAAAMVSAVRRMRRGATARDTATAAAYATTASTAADAGSTHRPGADAATASSTCDATIIRGRVLEMQGLK